MQTMLQLQAILAVETQPVFVIVFPDRRHQDVYIIQLFFDQPAVFVLAKICRIGEAAGLSSAVLVQNSALVPEKATALSGNRLIYVVLVYRGTTVLRFKTERASSKIWYSS